MSQTVMPHWGDGPGNLGALFPKELGETGSSVFFGDAGVEDPRRVNPEMEIKQLAEIMEEMQAKEEMVPGGGAQEYLLQEVNRWNKRIQRYQDDNRELVKRNESLSEDVEKARVDKIDIIEHLREEEKKKKVELQRLAQELKETAETKDARIASLEKELAEFQDTSAERIDCLTEQIAQVERQLDTLKHFEQEKSKMDAELKHLNETIMREQIQHRESIRNLERQWEIERDRRNKEEEKAIAKAKEDMFKIQDQHISEVTKKAIEDNAHLEREIAYQSRTTKELLAQNEDFTRSTIHLRRELEVQQDAERVLAQKNCSYQKTIKALLAKMKKLEGENLQFQGEMYSFTAAGGPRAPRPMSGASSDAPEGVEELQAKLGALKEDARTSRAQLKRMMAKVSKMEALMEESARFIMSTGEPNSRPSSQGKLPQVRGAAGAAGQQDRTADYAVQLYIRLKSQLSLP